MDIKRTGAQKPIVLQLQLSGRSIKEVDVDFTGSDTVEARKSLVREYYGGILLSACEKLVTDSDWQLVLVCQSKMNFSKLPVK